MLFCVLFLKEILFRCEKISTFVPRNQDNPKRKKLRPLREKIATLKGNKKNMKKLIFFTILFTIITITGWAKTKNIVWDAPTTEYGTSYGDGYFYLALDVTKVELKSDETVVYITAAQRTDEDRSWFRFAGNTYLKVGDQRYTIVSADGIELDKKSYTDKYCKHDMAFHFPPLPKGTTSFDFIEGDGKGAFQIKGIKPVEERWKQLFPSYWRDNQGDWKIALLEDCAIYQCKFWNYKECEINHITGEAEIVMQNGSDELLKKILEPYKGKFVLLDVWGTWCGPCKDALSHSTEEYAQLKDYDIEFLYLANRSSQDSWENVIKEYNVTGPNVAHYNLPEKQQAAIERHLNVHSFPTTSYSTKKADC